MLINVEIQETNMEFNKNKTKYLIFLLATILFSAVGLYSQTENYKVVVQFSVDSLTFKLYERPDGNSKIIGEIKNNDTIVITDRKKEWFKVITPSAVVGWFAYQTSGTYQDSRTNSWVTWNVAFKDFNSNEPIELRDFTFDSNKLNEKIKELEQKLVDLEKRVDQLEIQRDLLSSKATQSNLPTYTTQAGPQPPSDNQIKQAITNFFARKVPPTWAGSLMGGKDARIQSIEIYQIGNLAYTGTSGRHLPGKFISSLRNHFFR